MCDGGGWEDRIRIAPMQPINHGNDKQQHELNISRRKILRAIGLIGFQCRQFNSSKLYVLFLDSKLTLNQIVK